MVDTFVKQLDGCNYLVNGVPSGGFNCTCAAHAMWLYRASQGKVKITACFCRTLTGDRSGGTHLGQMELISKRYGITDGRVYRPISTTTLKQIASTRRYGFHLNISYRVIRGTSFDCFRGNFDGNHDVYVSGLGTKANTWRVADPGADGRAPGIHTGYEDYPIDLLLRAAGALNVADPSEGYRALGLGKAYAYVTPADPIAAAPHHKAVTTGWTKLWNDSSKVWVYQTPPDEIIEVRGFAYLKGGVWCYPLTSGKCASYHPGYYIPKSKVKLVEKCA